MIEHVDPLYGWREYTFTGGRFYGLFGSRLETPLQREASCTLLRFDLPFAIPVGLEVLFRKEPNGDIRMSVCPAVDQHGDFVVVPEAERHALAQQVHHFLATKPTPRDHHVPADDCSCGYYVRKTLGGDMGAGQDRVVAYVQCFGKTILADCGYRTNQVKVLGMFLPVGWCRWHHKESMLCEASRLGIQTADGNDACLNLAWQIGGEALRIVDWLPNGAFATFKV